MDKDEIKSKVCEALQTVTDDARLKGTVEETTLDISLKSLGLDSLDGVELTMMLEDEFGLYIDDEDSEKWQTPRDILTYVEKAKA